MMANDRAVIETTRSAIERLHSMGIGYAHLFSPLHEDGLQDAMKRLTIFVHAAAMGRQDLEVVTPPVYGRYLLVYSTDVPELYRRFAKRHGMGHVVAGHVTEPHYLRARNDHMTHEERVCDLFALADLCPFWMLDELRKGRSSWGALKQMICRIVRQHTLDWPEDRVFDRATLRLSLYREHGL